MPGYDPADLSIETAGSGFVVGRARVGTGPVGPESSQTVDAADQLTGLSIEYPADVDSGLFISPGLPTLSITAKFENAPDIFRDQIIRITHRGQGVVFRGRIRKAQRSVRLDMKQRDAKRWLFQNIFHFKSVSCTV